MLLHGQLLLIRRGTLRKLLPMATERPSSVHRAATILDLLGSAEAVERGGLGVVEIARRVGREKSQISRALRVLEETGLAERDPETRTYRLGLRIVTMARHAERQWLLARTPPVLGRLTVLTRERAHLSVLDDQGVLTLLSRTPTPVRDDWAGRFAPVHNTSSGRALLFDHPDDVARRLFAGGTAPAALPAGVDLDELVARLRRARNQRFAWVDEEFEPGRIAIAAPVRDLHGRVCAALNVSAPKARVAPQLDAVARLVQAAAGRITREMAGSPAGPQRTP